MFNIKNSFFFIFYLILNPRLIKGLLKGVYLPTLIQYEWTKKHNLKTFVDVGAYKGEDSKVISYLFPNIKIYAFEPDTNNYKYIDKKIKIKNFNLSSLALSNKAGIANFYSHPLSFLSSQLKTTRQPNDRKYFNRKTKKHSVNTDTLDNYFKNIKLNRQILLKVDTQGTEDLVLLGATKTLKKVDIVLIETPFQTTYKNQTSFDKIYNILIKNNFQYVGEAKESQFYPIFSRQVSCNALFLKNS